VSDTSIEKTENTEAGANRRLHIRFDKLFPVLLSSEIFGDLPAIARNISTGGLMVEGVLPLPLGTLVFVHFKTPGNSMVGADEDSDIIAKAEVKHHYCMNAGNDQSMRAMGLRFIDFTETAKITTGNSSIH